MNPKQSAEIEELGSVHVMSINELDFTVSQDCPCH